MSSVNPINAFNLDSRYAKPTDVSTAIANQAATDAGQYAIKAQSLAGPTNVMSANGNLVAGVPNTIDATNGNITVLLPTPIATGQLLPVEKVDSSVNNVAINGVIRGTSSSVSLFWQNETIVFEAESLTSWRPIAGHKTKSSLDAAYLASPALLGTPTAPTQSVGDSSTKLATTAFVSAALPGPDAPAVAHGRPHTFDPANASYNMTPSAFRQGRAAIASARAGLGACDITVYGDSRAQGSGLAVTTKSYQNSWVGRLRTRLAGGSGAGIFWIWDNIASYDDRFSSTGTWTGHFDGPFSAALVSATATASYTFTDTFDSITIYTLYGSGNWNYSLDGGATVPISGTTNRIGSSSWARTVVPAGTLAAHTLTVNWTTGTLYLGGFEPHRGTNSFRVHSIAHAGYDVTRLLNSDGSGWNSKETVWLTNAPSIGIIDLAINSFNNQVSLATFSADTQIVITNIATTGSPVLFAPFDYANSPAQTIPLSSYISTYYDLADANNIPLIDLNWWFKSDTLYPSNPSGYYADGIHFKDLGHSSQELFVARALGLTALNT